MNSLTIKEQVAIRETFGLRDFRRTRRWSRCWYGGCQVHVCWPNTHGFIRYHTWLCLRCMVMWRTEEWR